MGQSLETEKLEKHGSVEVKDYWEDSTTLSTCYLSIFFLRSKRLLEINMDKSAVAQRTG